MMSASFYSWEAIAAYVNQHAPGASITGKEALKQAKMLSREGKYGSLIVVLSSKEGV